MWRMFKSLGVWYPDNGYDDSGAAAKSGKLQLDKVDVAGKADVRALKSGAEQLGFRAGIASARILLEPDFAREQVIEEGLLNDFKQSQLRKDGTERPGKSVSEKWLPHLHLLKDWNVVTTTVWSAIFTVCLLCLYFEIAKSNNTARTIFNGRILSKVCKAPPTVNLLDIADLLRMLSTFTLKGVVYSDIRHWFHQLSINIFLQSLFVVHCGEMLFAWKVLPMGWAWSPRLCQCLGWILILHVAKDAKKPFHFDMPTNMNEPPKFVRVMRTADKKCVGFVTLLYDNVGAFFSDSTIAHAFKSHLASNYRFFSITPKFHFVLTKEILRTNLIDEGPTGTKRKRKDNNREGIMPERLTRTEQAIALEKENKRRLIRRWYQIWLLVLPKPVTVYRGVQFARSTADKVVWRCDPEKVAKWRKMNPLQQQSSAREIATVICTILWVCTVFMTPLCKVKEVIDILRSASQKAQLIGWDEQTVELSASALEMIDRHWRWVMAGSWCYPPRMVTKRRTLRLATDASDDGGGMVRLDAPYYARSYQWKEGFKKVSIFLRELSVAVFWLTKFIKEDYNDIILLMDNSAGIQVLLKLYSTNNTACRWMCDLADLIKRYDVILRVNSVISEDNVADDPSRFLRDGNGKPVMDLDELGEVVKHYWKDIKEARLRKCLDLVEDEERGMRNTVRVTSFRSKDHKMYDSPSSTLRHEEAKDELEEEGCWQDLCDDLEGCSFPDEEATSRGFPLEHHAPTESFSHVDVSSTF